MRKMTAVLLTLAFAVLLAGCTKTDWSDDFAGIITLRPDMTIDDVRTLENDVYGYMYEDNTWGNNYVVFYKDEAARTSQNYHLYRFDDSTQKLLGATYGWLGQDDERFFSDQIDKVKQLAPDYASADAPEHRWYGTVNGVKTEIKIKEADETNYLIVFQPQQ